jgi:hypothetical protein
MDMCDIGNAVSSIRFICELFSKETAEKTHNTKSDLAKSSQLSAEQ